MTVGLSADTTKKTKDVSYDTSKFAGYNLTQFRAKVEEGLKGKDKEFFERIKGRGIEATFEAYDNDASGKLSGEESITLSAVGVDQTNFVKALRGGSAYMNEILAKITAKGATGTGYAGVLTNFANSLRAAKPTGAAASIAGAAATGASAAVNFAMQFNGRSAAQMSGPMSATGFHSQAWCADFVYYALKNAGTVPPGYDSINHAYCPTIAQWARQNGRAFSDPSQAKPGDLLIMNSEGHIGIVTKVDSQGIHTIEGNTTNANGDYGAGYVCTKVRDFGSVSTFVRI